MGVILILKRALLLAAGLLAFSALAACVRTDIASYPEWGERLALTGSLICNTMDPKGKMIDTRDYTVAEVGSEKIGYKYYAFGRSKQVEDYAPEPIIFSLHGSASGIFVGQAVEAVDSYDYFWYDASKGAYKFTESSDMEDAITTLAARHHVLIDPKERSYYATFKGTEANIRKLLEDLGPHYKGNTLECAAK